LRRGGGAGCGAGFGAVGVTGRDDDELRLCLVGRLEIWFPDEEEREPGGAERDDALAVRIAGLVVLDEQIQRMALVGHLPRPIRPPDGSEQCGVSRRAQALACRLPAAAAHTVAHAPEHALLVPESALNRYSVWPWELTRIRARLLFAPRTGVTLAAVDVFAGGVAAVAPPPPPQAATVRAASGIAAAPARKMMGLLRVMSLLRLGDRRSQRQAVIESRNA